jgi:hypothetical protein
MFGNHKEYPMLRQYVCGVCALIVAVGCLLAAEIKGTVKSVDADKSTITITDEDNKDKTLTVDKDAKIVGGKGDIKGGLKNEKAFKSGAKVTVKTETKDGKEVVTEIKVGGGKKKDKDK